MVEIIRDNIGLAFSIILNAIMGFVLWSIRNAFVSKAEFNDQNAKSDADKATMKQDIESLKKDVKSIPTTKDFHELAIGNARLEEQMKSAAEMLKSLTRQLNLMDEYIRKGDR